jgi:hypothetical protein
MENLAMVAHNPEVLPCYSVQDYGAMDITDKIGVIGVLTIPPKGVAGTGSIDPSASRTAKGNWTLTQVSAPEKLRALHLAFRYVVYPDPRLLIIHDHRVSLGRFEYKFGIDNCVEAVEDDTEGQFSTRERGIPGYYFDVAGDLATLPGSWLHICARDCAPSCARFTASCGDVCVWVGNEDMGALSQFTLVVQRISRQIIAAAYYPAPDYIAIEADCPVHTHCGLPNNGITYKVNPIVLPIDCYGNVVIVKQRQDSITLTDPKLKASINASIKTP